MSKSPHTDAIILAGGSGERFGGGEPKQFAPLSGKPLVASSIEAFENVSSVTHIILVVPRGQVEFAETEIVKACAFTKVTSIVEGGATRAESTRAGLAEVNESAKLIAIHDGARATVDPADIERVINAAENSGAAILASPVADTLKKVEGDKIIETVARAGLYRAETPQVFAADLIRRAHQRALQADRDSPTDDASLVEALGEKVQVIISQFTNFKVTTAEDLILAEALLANRRKGVSV